MKRYTLAELQALPTIKQGHTANLKVETQDTRVWLSRLGVEDGEPYENHVSVEKFDQKNGWRTVQDYPAK